MSHCVDFWHKWRKEPNFCGLSPQSVSEIKGYLELVDKIKTAGISEDIIYEKCTSGACRPLLRVSDDDTRIRGLNYLVSSLKRGEKITGGDLQSSINAWLGKDTVCKVPVKPAPESTQLRTDVNQAVENEGAEVSSKLDGKGKFIHEEPEACTSPPVPEKPIFPVAEHGRFMNPGSVAGAPPPDKPLPGSWINQPPKDPEAIKTAQREELEKAAERLLDLMPQSIKLIATDQLRDNRIWKVKDFWYFAAQALAEKGVKK
ncbi:MAG: hypothetical protein M0Q91_05440 [Methanoregula sp.]|jgi:hypothetical protein|nr:hypothetical protein [Methanoregula sp.]